MADKPNKWIIVSIETQTMDFELCYENWQAEVKKRKFAPAGGFANPSADDSNKEEIMDVMREQIDQVFKQIRQRGEVPNSYAFIIKIN
jgi:hypothetical protein